MKAIFPEIVTNKQMNLHFSPYPMLLITIFPLLLMIILILKQRFLSKTTTKNLPPSPRKLPVFGHLHLLGKHPHRSLQKLAQKHGPVMLLQMGSVKTLVVSSAEAAQEIMKTQDLNFVNRPKSEVSRKLLYDHKDVSVAPYGEYWRQLKSICVMQLLSNKRVQSIQVQRIRNEEIDLLVRKIQEEMMSENMVNLSEMFVTLTNDVICRAAFGRKYSEGESGRKFRKLMSEFVTALGAIDFGTFLPCLGWIDYVSGFSAKLDRISKEMDEFLERVLEEHLNLDGDHEGRKNIPTEAGGRDFVDVLLGIYNDGVSSDDAGDSSITRDSIKALILDIFAGGTDTTYTVLEWAMTLLIKHPNIMEDLQNEVRAVAKESRGIITDQDLEKMRCLKAVIKETLRLHPPIPLLVPRTIIKDSKVLGFDVEAETMVITNSFAIGRDPRSWDDPDEFRPEKFLVDDSTASINFRGQDFQLIPFGSGRRGCPGISFAVAVNEAVLANLMLRFDWQLPEGNSCLDMAECIGVTMHHAPKESSSCCCDSYQLIKNSFKQFDIKILFVLLRVVN